MDRFRVYAAFAIVYVIWGSTYLAIRIVIETLPPFLGAGVRYLVAGGGVYAWFRLRGAARPAPIYWRTALVTAAFLLLGGNGAVFWAEQSVPSGAAALIVAIVPLWMAILGHYREGQRIGWQGWVGMALGFSGVALLIGPGELGGERIDPLGGVVLLGATLSWAYGSFYSRKAPHPPSALLGTGMTMLCGGLQLLAASALAREWRGFTPAEVSARSLVALAYLVVFGSIVAFSAYLWLMRHETPAHVATYAYVNPVIAVFLGWLVLDEQLNLRIGLASAIIVSGVGLMVSRRPTRVEPRPLVDPPEDAGRTT